MRPGHASLGTAPARAQAAGSGDASVAGLGMATSLGVDAITACAAARAGLVRPRALEPCLTFDPGSGEMEPVIGHPVSFLSGGFSGVARLARLGALALGDLVGRRILAPADLPRTGLVLALGSGYFVDALAAYEVARDQDAAFDAAVPAGSAGAERQAALEALLVPRLLELAGLPAPAEHALVFEDQAGGASALSLGMAALSERRVDRCLVGGIDSYCDPQVVDALEGLDLLKAPRNPVGLAPGEAAAFVLLERGARAGAVSLHARAIATGLGAHQLAPATHACRRLQEAVAEALEQSGGGSLWTLGTHNGTAWAAAEWGRVLSTAPRVLADASHGYPAISFGETGAASSLVALCLATRAFERGYAPAETAFIWASSPSGPKAAFCVQRT